MPVLVTARLTKSSSKVKIFQESSAWSDLSSSEAYRPVVGRKNIDTNNLVQLKGFELSLKRKVAERYGGSYRDLRGVGRKRQSHHKSVQTLRTVSASDLSERERGEKTTPQSGHVSLSGALSQSHCQGGLNISQIYISSANSADILMSP